MLPAIGELNALDEAGSVRALQQLFEGAPEFLRRLAAGRPYGSYDELLDRAAIVAVQLPEAEQVALINSHPRIGAAPATLSEQSFREQGHDREAGTIDLELGTTDLQARLARLNEAYEQRLGFRFVVFVAGRTQLEIARIMEEALTAERHEEIARALRDVLAIARDRAGRLAPS